MKENRSPPPGNRDGWLDLLRALAVSLVLASHGSWFFERPEESAFANVTATLGVEIFFVLSGFLVGGILFKQFESEASWQSLLSNFWARRWIRTLPSYYLFLGLNILIYQPSGLPSLGPYFAFLQNFAHPIPAFFPESWSLAIEELFYLFFPLVVMAFSKTQGRSTRAFILAGAFVFLLSLAARIGAVVLFEPTLETGIRKIAIFRLDAIMTGVFAYIAAGWIGARYRPALLMAGLALLAVSIAVLARPQPELDHSFFARTLLFNVVQLSIALLIIWGVGRINLPSVTATSVTALSKWSYSLYLVNIPVIIVIHSIWKLEPDVAAATVMSAVIYAGICLLFAAALYHYFERPILNWRDQRTLATS
ncbi:acyltransferase family protein [Bradyrhizobium sp. YR681]|uniref:acyltransferase family protein n=1 Tax=Bradyrhizobium sp. YR681 TaxID=1144344 RepID=UPI00030D0966|nr:acyltransferase [Bradyrhizobium sp. YR681]